MRILPVLLACLLLTSAQAQRNTLTAADLTVFEGAWTGQLVHMDHTSGAETAIDAILRFVPIAAGTWHRLYGYPKEPGSNETDTLRLSVDGRMLNEMHVIGVERDAESTRIVFEEDGEDNDKPARIRKTWTGSSRICTMRKDVRSEGAAEFSLRHEYRLKR
ncbi:MAG: hypothetical protein ABI599_11160 [Flavobacteriales bacterium]